MLYDCNKIIVCNTHVARFILQNHPTAVSYYYEMHYAGDKSFIKRHKSPATFLQFSACHGDMHQTYPVGHLKRCILGVHLICIYLYIFIMLSCRTTIGLHTALTTLLLHWTRYRAIRRGKKIRVTYLFLLVCFKQWTCVYECICIVDCCH